MQQRVADGDLGTQVGRVGEPRDAAGLHGSDEQAEPGDRDGERVEVDAADRVEAALDERADVAAGLALAPVARAAGAKAPSRKWPEPQVGSISRRLGEAELVDRRLERAVEDELLDELRRLQQRVLLLRRLGEILVEVAEEARAQSGSVKS